MTKAHARRVFQTVHGGEVRHGSGNRADHTLGGFSVRSPARGFLGPEPPEVSRVIRRKPEGLVGAVYRDDVIWTVLAPGRMCDLKVATNRTVRLVALCDQYLGQQNA